MGYYREQDSINFHFVYISIEKGDAKLKSILHEAPKGVGGPCIKAGYVAPLVRTASIFCLLSLRNYNSFSPTKEKRPSTPQSSQRTFTNIKESMAIQHSGHLHNPNNNNNNATNDVTEDSAPLQNNSDKGGPSGSKNRPMLDLLESSKFKDVLTELNNCILLL